jgi:hypothetical protein
MSLETVRLEEALTALERSSNRLDGLDLVREIIASSNSLPQGTLKFLFCPMRALRAFDGIQINLKEFAEPLTEGDLRDGAYPEQFSMQ